VHYTNVPVYDLAMKAVDEGYAVVIVPAVTDGKPWAFMKYWKPGTGDVIAMCHPNNMMRAAFAVGLAEAATLRLAQV
jgi:hypothetical protein